MKLHDEPICVAPAGDHCGEGAVWHSGEQALYWVDINRFLVHRFDPANGTVKSWFFDEPATAVILTDRDDTLAILLASRVILWQPRTDTRRDQGFFLPGYPAVRLNEGKADPRGSLWLGSMRNNVHPDGSAGEAGGTDGMLYRADPDGEVTLCRDRFGIQNTLGWSPDQKHLYFADTPINTIYVADYDNTTGAMQEERPFFTGFVRGLPDGSIVDFEGYLWNCRYGGGCIVRIAPDGAIDTVVEMPVSNITTCAFGGSENNILYVTTAALGAPEGERLAGSLFAIHTSVQGQTENRFKIRD